MVGLRPETKIGLNLKTNKSENVVLWRFLIEFVSRGVALLQCLIVAAFNKSADRRQFLPA